MLKLIFRDNDNDVVNDPAVKTLVLEQTNQWSEMVERHRREEWQLLRTHIQAQEDVLKKLMEQQQQQQLKELETIFEKWVGIFCSQSRLVHKWRHSAGIPVGNNFMTSEHFSQASTLCDVIYIKLLGFKWVNGFNFHMITCKMDSFRTSYGINLNLHLSLRYLFMWFKKIDIFKRVI